MIQYPNKIYTLDVTLQGDKTVSHFSVVVAASDKDTAKEHVKKHLGLDGEPVWLMNACYPTIYSRDGKNPEGTQAKILNNSRIHVDASGRII